MCVCFFNAPAPTEIYTLSLHDALPISTRRPLPSMLTASAPPSGSASTAASACSGRSEEHTSELQSLTNLVCRLLLEKKNHNYLRSANVITCPRGHPEAGCYYLADVPAP